MLSDAKFSWALIRGSDRKPYPLDEILPCNHSVRLQRARFLAGHSDSRWFVKQLDVVRSLVDRLAARTASAHEGFFKVILIKLGLYALLACTF